MPQQTSAKLANSVLKTPVKRLLEQLRQSDPFTKFDADNLAVSNPNLTVVSAETAQSDCVVCRLHDLGGYRRIRVEFDRNHDRCSPLAVRPHGLLGQHLCLEASPEGSEQTLHFRIPSCRDDWRLGEYLDHLVLDSCSAVGGCCETDPTP